MPNLIPITPEQFASKAWTRGGFAFAQKDHLIPFVLAELAQLVPVMPLAFVPLGEGYQAVGLASLQPGSSLYVSPDGQWLAGGGTSRNIRVWRTSDGEPVHVLYHPGQVSSVVVSPDGATVATGLCEASDAALQCTRGAVRLWNLSTGRLIKSLADFPDWVEGVVFSGDGSVVIAGSRDGTLRAYSMLDFAPLLTASAPGGVMALAISPESRLLGTGSRGPDIHLWRVEP